MKKAVLVYCWNSVNDEGLIRGLDELNIPYVTFSGKMKDYHADGDFSVRLISFLQQNSVSAILSYDYFPLISMVCQLREIPYYSWVYDCPMLTVNSLTVSNSYNHFFSFDRVMTERLLAMGAAKSVSLPLGADPKLERDVIEHPLIDIAFVGGLYNGEKNRLRRAKISERCQGFLEGVMAAQGLIYGTNFVREALVEEIVDEVCEACELSLGPNYIRDRIGLAADAINMEVAARERETVLKALATGYSVFLYTGSKLPKHLEELVVPQGSRTEQKKGLHPNGYVSYLDEMPGIFQNAKINLNITSKSIESGVPLRVFDIMAAGGFCLTNYQPEIEELFEDGIDLVMYTGIEDLLEKVEYYLSHEKERAVIARNGHNKVMTQYKISNRLALMELPYSL